MSEDHRVATFQTNHVLSLSCRIEQKTVDVCLLLVVIAGTLAHVDLLGFLICQIGIVDEVIVEDDVGGINGFRCLDGKKVRVARTEADEGYGTLLIEDALRSECLLQVLASFLSCDGKESLKRMGWERKHFGDFILHAESLQGTGCNDGCIVFAIFYLLNSFFNTTTYPFDSQVRT